GMALPMATVADGLSNVLMVGECSDYAYSANRVENRVDGSHPNGWYTSAMSPGSPPRYLTPGPLAMLPPRPYSIFNLTTINDPPTSPYLEGTPTTPGMYRGGGEPMNPLTSPHSGGVHGLLGDGSVRFLSNSIALITLKS